MSSLTDIIFLLLIFFMLTSTLVKIQPFDLPESDSKTVASTSIVVTVEQNGKVTLQGNEVPKRSLEKALRMAVRTAENRDGLTVTIAAELGTPFDSVVDIMNIAAKLRVKAILATQPKT